MSVVNKGVLLFLFSFVLVVALVSAGEFNIIGGKMVGRNFDAIKCKTDLNIKIIESLESISTSSNLSQYSTLLRADLNKLESLENEGNYTAFRDYVKNIFDEDLKKAAKGVRDWKKDNLKNLTKEQRQSLREDYKNLKESSENCQSEALKGAAQNRLSEYNLMLDRYDNKTAEIASHGIDVSSLYAITKDAREQIIIPLQSALDAANDSEGIKKALKSYCLFDGCKDGVNFHLAAKYEIAKLALVISYAESKAGNSTEAQAFLDKAKDSLAKAQTFLNSAGNARYDYKKNGVWENIRESYKYIKEARKVLRGKDG